MEFEKIKVSDLIKSAFGSCPACGGDVHLYMDRWSDERMVATISCNDRDCKKKHDYEVIYDVIESADDFKSAMVNALDNALARYEKKAGRAKK